jgi:spore coat protein U-like protein
MFALSRSLALAALLLWTATGWAASPAQQTTKPAATVANVCSIQSLDTMAFGTYDPTATAGSVSTSQVSVVCTKKAAVNIGATSAGSGYMTGPAGQRLAYGIYTDSAFSQAFGADSYVATLPSTGFACFQTYQGAADNAPTLNASSPVTGVAATYFGPTLNTNGNIPHNNNFTRFTGTAASESACQTSYSINLAQASIRYGAPPTVGTVYGAYTIYVAKTGSGLNKTSTSARVPMQIPIYGKVAGSQDVGPGSYADTVTLTFTF